MKMIAVEDAVDVNAQRVAGFGAVFGGLHVKPACSTFQKSICSLAHRVVFDVTILPAVAVVAESISHAPGLKSGLGVWASSTGRAKSRNCCESHGNVASSHGQRLLAYAMDRTGRDLGKARGKMLPSASRKAHT